MSYRISWWLVAVLLLAWFLVVLKITADSRHETREEQVLIPFVLITETGYIAKGLTKDGQCVIWDTEQTVNHLNIPWVLDEIDKVQNMLYEITYDQLVDGHVFIKCEELENEQ